MQREICLSILYNKVHRMLYYVVIKKKKKKYRNLFLKAF